MSDSGKGFNRGKDTSPPLFSTTSVEELVIDRETWRRFFAGCALVGLSGDVNKHTTTPVEIARDAIKLADEMVDELEIP